MNEPKIVKGFEIVNGIRVEKSTNLPTELRDGIPHGLKMRTSMNQSPKVNVKDPTTAEYYGLTQQKKDKLEYDDPRSIKTKPLPYHGNAPRNARFLTAKEVLKFNAYFTEEVVESPSETSRVRRADLFYYMEDHTMHIEEPRQENSGIPQGKFLRRQKIMKLDGTPYSLKDITVGGVVHATSRDFHIVDCDGPSRKLLREMGHGEQADSMPIPTAEYDVYAKEMQEKRGGNFDQNYGRQLTSMKYFMEASLGQNVQKHASKVEGNPILRFFLVWDDRATLYGSLTTFAMHYYMYDKTIEIVEDKVPNAGKDPFPKLLGRKRMPKQHQGEIYNDADRGVEPDNPKGHYYEEEDFQVGNKINVWGREMTITGCDKQTQKYYMENYGMQESQFEPIPVERPQKPVYERVPPQHTGIGSEEDSLASWLHLHPRKPRKDLRKLNDLDGKELHFSAIPLNGPSVKQGRKFSLKYFLADDTVGVYDVPVKNSGVTPGCFLRRSKFKNIQAGRYFNPQDFVVDAEIELCSNKFKLVYADEFTRNYIAGIPEPAGQQDESTLTEMMKFKLWQKNKSLGFLKEAFRHVDSNSDSTISLDELKSYLQDSCCRGDKLNVNAAISIFNEIDTNKDNVLDFNEFCAALAEDYKIDVARLQGTETNYDIENVAPLLRRLAEYVHLHFLKANLSRAHSFDPLLFDKLVKRQIPGNTNKITMAILRESLVAIRYYYFKY